MRPIFAPTNVTLTDLRRRVEAVRPTVSSLFLTDMLPALYDEGVRHGLDIFAFTAQSYHETGGGYFDGNVEPWQRNTAGIKVRFNDNVRELLGEWRCLVPWTRVSPDHPLVHAQFRNWHDGARAHAQHVDCYAGVWPTDEDGEPEYIIDPRWDLVWGQHAITYWDELSGRWAKSATYAQAWLPLADALEAA